MAIYCKKCGYQMLISEAAIHISPIIFNFIKDVAIPFIHNYFLKKGLVSSVENFSESLIIDVLNKDKVPCQSCAKYEWWQNAVAKEMNVKHKEEQLQ